MRASLKVALTVIAIMWGVFLVNLVLPFDLNIFGVRPRHLGGLIGIPFMPFLHGSLAHIKANTLPLFFLLLIAFSYDHLKASRAITTIVLINGLGVWIFGTPGSVHIGASGLIFGLVGFLMFIGIFQRKWSAIFVSLAVAVLYGGIIFGLTDFSQGISWTGHFFGFLGGIYAAKSIGRKS